MKQSNRYRREIITLVQNRKFLNPFIKDTRSLALRATKVVCGKRLKQEKMDKDDRKLKDE